MIISYRHCSTCHDGSPTGAITYRGNSMVLRVDTIIRYDSIQVPVYVRDSAESIDTTKLINDYRSKVIYADTVLPLKNLGTLSLGLSTQYNRLSEFHYKFNYTPSPPHEIKRWSAGLGVARIDNLTYGIVGVGYKPKFTDRLSIESGAMMNKSTTGIYLKTNIHF